MEVGTRVAATAAFGTHDRSPKQTKLTERYRVAKLPDETKAVLLQQQANNVGLCRLPIFAKPEPMECHGFSASLLCRASNMFGGAQSQHNNRSKENPNPVSFQRVKSEHLSPSSCVTNDSVFHDAEGGVSNTDVESLATAHANLMCGATKGDDPTPALQSFASHGCLMTAVVMLQENSKPCNGNEPNEKLMTAVDMLGRGGGFVHPPEAAATPMKLMTALHMFPTGTADVAPALKHVKSEPVESSPELELLGIPKEKSNPNNSNFRSFRNAVKEEMLNSALETYGFTNQAAHLSSESEYGSEDNEDGGLPTRVPEGVPFIDPGDIVGVVSQKGDDDGGCQREIKPRNSNPGRRIQGGRIYDSAFGLTCHWCRQKTVEPHVKCRECSIHYCGSCLMNRNGENIREELCEGVRWLCPKCRNGCGLGCENCCNCGPCRKALGKTPTGQMVGVARNAGFENAHDYLVHLETGESPEEIAQRKVGRGWTNCGRFKCADTSEYSESGDGGSSSEGADEFTLNEEISTQLHQGKLDMKFVKKFVESQKRKRVGMRAALPAKRRQVESSSAIRRRDVDDILAGLEVTGQSLSKEKEDAVKTTGWRVQQKLETKEKCTEDDSGNQGSGMRTSACKREYVELNDGSNSDSAVAKRRYLEGFSGNQRLALLNESSRPSLVSPFSKVKCKIEPTTFSEGTSNADIPCGQGGTLSASEREAILKMRGARALNGVSSPSNMECPSDPQGTDYRMKLKSVLARSFDAKELEALDYSVRCRKPVQKQRQMRGRVVDVVTEDEGLSYLDHHQDFAAKLEYAQSPPEKLALLRGFFFWLQHSCMEGAFKPWPSGLPQSRHQSGDCIETEGPDCQVTAVVLQLDEGNEANRRVNPKFLKTVKRHEEMPSFPLGSSKSRQSLIPFQVKKNLVQQIKPKMRSQVMAPPAKNYRVVLGLLAPALSKM